LSCLQKTQLIKIQAQINIVLLSCYELQHVHWLKTGRLSQHRTIER